MDFEDILGEVQQGILMGWLGMGGGTAGPPGCCPSFCFFWGWMQGCQQSARKTRR